VLDDAPAALRETLACAEVETRNLRHGYIGSEHLLLGLLRLEGTRAGDHLRRASVGHAQVTERIVTIVGVGGDDVNTQQVLPFTPNAIVVCRRVLEDAGKTGAATIGTEHVLRALLLRRDSLAVRVLEDLGVDRTELERHLRRPRPDVEFPGRTPSARGLLYSVP
jgi:ATP-dependent Clp protease ATP-binding subunit ClpC